MRQYSLLVLRYNRAFHDKWIQGQAAAGEPLLGTADIQSLADLGNSFEFIQSMRVVPFSLRAILQLAVVTLCRLCRWCSWSSRSRRSWT